jgi:pilus assembly protein FimV
MGMALWRPRAAKPFGTSRWWDLTQQPSAQQAAVVPSRFDSVRSESEDLRAQLPPRVASALSASTLRNSIDTPIGGLEIKTITPAPEHPRAGSSDTLPMSLPEGAPAAATAEPSMEALIDLEQEADFFVVIGQDEAAADLLSKHLKSDAVISALPFLKLLEIHRRRGDKTAHGTVAEAFQRRFGAAAPTWEASATGGRGLDDYPAIFTRLQALWASPRDVMRALESALFHRDPTDELLDLAAYRDLLFLYAVARDRSDTTPAEDIDVLLPIDGAPVDVHLPIFPSQSHVTVLHPRVSRSAPLDFDISLSFEPESELRQAV